jgi:hypothetical protein
MHHEVPAIPSPIELEILATTFLSFSLELMRSNVQNHLTLFVLWALFLIIFSLFLQTAYKVLWSPRRIYAV